MITLVAILKDESRYVQEWIAHHHLIGITHFQLYLHNCQDDTRQQIESLNLNTNITELHGHVDQLTIYREAAKSIPHWMLAIDADEFIHTEQPLNPTEGGLVLYQHIMGPNNHTKRPNGLVIENYTTRHDPLTPLPALEQHSKVNIQRVKYILNPNTILDLPTPHTAITRLPIRDTTHRMYSYTNSPTFEKACIYHYFTKSHEDWQIKTGRPRISGAPKYQQEIFNFHAQGCVKDTTMLKYAQPIKDFLRERNASASSGS